MMGTVAALDLEDRAAPFVQKSGRCCSQFPTKIVLLFGVGFIYLFIGGAVMSELEADHERQAEAQYHAAIEDAFTKTGLNASQRAAITAMIDELESLRLTVANPDRQDWTFVGATYYSLTVVTTIGYGWIAPKTVGGQIFTVAYSVIGIPLVFYMFAYLGRKLMDVIGFRISSLREGKEFKRKQLQDDSVVLPMLVALVIATMLICVIAAAYHTTEDWSYWQATYFVFVTMTTIGFGDSMPQLDDRLWPLLLSLFGVFVMLSVYSYLLNVAIVLFTKFISRVAQAGIGAMDVEGLGHVGLLDIVAYVRGKTAAHREEYQSKLVVKLLQHDLDLTQKARLIQAWGTFCINTTTRQYSLPKGLVIMAVVGGPGAGKTHMTKLLAKQHGIVRVAVEELVLAEVVNKSKLGLAITSALKAGLVLPDGLVVSLLRKRLSPLQPATIVLLDGFPSSASLVEAIDSHVKLIERFILLDCTDDTLKARFKLFNVSDSVKGLLSHHSLSTRSHSRSNLLHMSHDSDSGTSSHSANTRDLSTSQTPPSDGEHSPTQPNADIQDVEVVDIDAATEATTIDINFSVSNDDIGVFAEPSADSIQPLPRISVDIFQPSSRASPRNSPKPARSNLRHNHPTRRATAPDTFDPKASESEPDLTAVRSPSHRTHSVPARHLADGPQTPISKHFSVLDELMETSQNTRRGFFGRSRQTADPSLSAHSDVTYYSPQDQLEVFEDSLDNFKADRAAFVELVMARLFVIDAEGALELVERDVQTAFNSERTNDVPDEFAVSSGYVFRHQPKVGVPYRRIPSAKSARRRQRQASVRSLPDELDPSLTPERDEAIHLKRFSSANPRRMEERSASLSVADAGPLTRSTPALLDHSRLSVTLQSL
eukprot:TRINITY_DN11693_c0_g2_i2.p1 TRINITY_DN11693_c0_g2~~TRINITY_DN11693_c0_g2_i2.p1  ORF type:complete len:880 (+),score=227.08 TRINITY_DN11693_c0_g2_i2:225-2864(+)